jgi:hypothetical protein
VPFLSNANPQVRQLALSNLLGHTLPSSIYRSALFLAPVSTTGGAGKGPIWTLKLLCRDQPMIAHDAFKALVNLSDATLVKKECSDDEFLVFLVSYIVVRLSSLPRPFASLPGTVCSGRADLPLATRS